MVDHSEVMSSVMSELNINTDSKDLDGNFNGEEQGKEAEVEAVEEVEATEATQENPDAPEGEEKTEVSPEAEEAVEEPKLTAKEFQEIAAREQKLVEMEKSFTDRMALKEKEFQEKYHEKIKAHDDLDQFLAHVADTDAEVFELIKGGYQAWQREFNNPAVQALREKNEALEKKLDSFMQQGTDQLTLAKLDAEKNQLKTTLGKEAEAAGLKVDWDKLDETWAKYPGISLEKAFYAEHGAALIKAKESKAKVAVAEKKVQSRPSVSTAGNVKASNSKAQEKVPSDAFGSVYHFARKMGVKI